ncbi:MAG: hypothetical protein ACYTDE_08115, partial [Planctomycetota bacterium]
SYPANTGSNVRTAVLTVGGRIPQTPVNRPARGFNDRIERYFESVAVDAASSFDLSPLWKAPVSRPVLSF